MPALPVPTHRARSQHGEQRRHEGVTHPHHQLIEESSVRRCRPRMVLRELRDPGRILRHCRDLPAGLERAQNRQGRKQERESVEDRLPTWVPPLQAQPEPESNHGVDPGDQQHCELERATQRIGHEIRLQYRRVIADAGAIEGVGDARLEDVVREKKRNRESEHELGRLGERHLERAAQPERPKRQAVMGREGAVEEDGAELRRPIFVDVLERAIHGLDRNEAQAMIDEMGRHVCQHDESRRQPQPPDHAVHPCSCFKMHLA